MSPRSTRDVYRIQGNYGHGWETENEETTYADAKRSLREYRDNGPGRYRILPGIEKIEGLPTFYLQHGHGTAGPFQTESVTACEDWHPQKRRGTVTATRFMVQWYGRWYRLYSDSAASGLPHFIMAKGARVYVSGVSP